MMVMENGSRVIKACIAHNNGIVLAHIPHTDEYVTWRVQYCTTTKVWFAMNGAYYGNAQFDDANLSYLRRATREMIGTFPSE